MGIHSRDYIRESRPDGGFGGASGLWAVKYLLIANVLVFLLQYLTQGVATQWLALHLDDLYRFQIWRLVTYGFCHDTRGLLHILFNMYFLWMFGRTLEPIYGSREFLAFYLAAVVVSGVCHLAFQLTVPEPRGVVGASGGVMGVVFLTAMHYPRMTIMMMLVIPIELRWLAVLYAVVDVLGVFHGGTNVAHFAHLGGAAFGMLYWKFDWRISSYFTSLRLPRFDRTFGSRRKIRLHRPSVPDEPAPEDDLDDRVDAILKKISEQGEASLTDDERETLKTASRRAASRRQRRT